MIQLLRPVRCFALLLAILLASEQVIAADRHAENGEWISLNGDAIRRTFEDIEVGDGVHYSYRFLGDGSFTGTEMGRNVQGAWRSTEKALCWRWIQPPGIEECYTVQRKGRELRAFRNGYEAWWGKFNALPQRRSSKRSKETSKK